MVTQESPFPSASFSSCLQGNSVLIALGLGFSDKASQKQTRSILPMALLPSTALVWCQPGPKATTTSRARPGVRDGSGVTQTENTGTDCRASSDTSGDAELTSELCHCHPKCKHKP